MTFGLTVFAWIFFRANSIEHALNFIKSSVFELSKNSFIQTYNFIYWRDVTPTICLIILFIIIEWFGRNSQFAIEKLFYSKKNSFLRYALYFFTALLIFIFSDSNKNEFIYFQF